jgi:hypothetical protein
MLLLMLGCTYYPPAGTNDDSGDVSGTDDTASLSVECLNQAETLDLDDVAVVQWSFDGLFTTPELVLACVTQDGLGFQVDVLLGTQIGQLVVRQEVGDVTLNLPDDTLQVFLVQGDAFYTGDDVFAGSYSLSGLEGTQPLVGSMTLEATNPDDQQAVVEVTWERPAR